MPIEMPVESRFIFNGSAVAFAGRIRRPDDVYVNAAAPCHLPVTGGLSEAIVKGPDTAPFQYKNLITFASAHSRAQGEYSDPRRAAEFTRGNHGQNELPTNTAVQTCLQGLRVHSEADATDGSSDRVFAADTLEVHLESTSNRRDANSFRSMSAMFKGLSLMTTDTQGNSTTANLSVRTATDIFDANDTKAKLLDTYSRDGDFRKKYAALFYPPGATLPGFIDNLFGKHEIPYADQGPIVATFVTSLEWDGTPPVGTEILNNRLTISGLGRIYFGEIIIDEGSRRVTLLRFELGSTNGGDASACEVVSNGTKWPPIR